MEPPIQRKAAYPAKVVATDGAVHLRAAHVLFDEATALRAVRRQTIGLVAAPFLDAVFRRTAAPLAVELLPAELTGIGIADGAGDASSPASLS